MYLSLTRIMSSLKQGMFTVDKLDKRKKTSKRQTTKILVSLIFETETGYQSYYHFIKFTLII